MNCELSEQPLGEICEFRRGLTYSKKDEVAHSGKVVLRANNIDLRSGRLDLTELRYLNESFEIPASKMVAQGSLLVCMASGSKSHLGKVALVDQDHEHAFGGFMGLLTPISGVVSPRYLYWILMSSEYKEFILRLSDGVNINNLKWSDLQHFPVPVPPLAEQERIVRILDNALSGLGEISVRSERIKHLTESLIQSRLDDIFGGSLPTGWRRYRMPEVAQSLDSQRIPVTRAKRRPGPFPYYGASGIVDWVDHYIFDCDALLVAEDGANLVSRATPVAFSVSGRYWVNNHAHVLRFRDGATQTLVENWFASVSLVEFLTGTAQPKLNQGALNSLEIPLPTALEERKSLAEGIVELRMQAGEATRIQADKELSLDQLRQSILHRAFTGQL